MIAYERAVFEREEKRFLTPQPIENPNGLREVDPRHDPELRPFIMPGASQYFVVSLKRGEVVYRIFTTDAMVGVFFPGNLGEYLIGVKFVTDEGVLLKEEWFLPEFCVFFTSRTPGARVVVQISRAPIFKK